MYVCSQPTILFSEIIRTASPVLDGLTMHYSRHIISKNRLSQSVITVVCIRTQCSLSGDMFADGSEICELHCRVEDEELYRSAAQVVDGTPCDAMSNDVCVDGVCQVQCQRRFRCWYW